MVDERWKLDWIVESRIFIDMAGVEFYNSRWKLRNNRANSCDNFDTILFDRSMIDISVDLILDPLAMQFVIIE